MSNREELLSQREKLKEIENIMSREAEAVLKELIVVTKNGFDNLDISLGDKIDNLDISLGDKIDNLDISLGDKIDKTPIQKLGEDLAVIIPTEICEKLDIREGIQVEIEPFLCGGEAGIRIKLKS